MPEKRFNAFLAHRLDVPERITWLPPAEVLSALHVQPGETVADVGAGTGYFSLPLAQAVGARGQVFAVDAQSGMLARLQEKLDSSRISNIELVHAEADATCLSSATCDVVLLANVWHEFDDRTAVLLEAKRILKKLGCIAILDWRPDVEPEHGPPLEHRLSASSAEAELLAAGFHRISQRNLGKYSWLVQAIARDEACKGLAE
ncbi:MAG TPA: methyltransferase domain-containing protein [Terracidiphilus sp.]|jgi:ubiquinone/menaquinone biosynthesis C-methylase UbiE|nr:methyltransferase domain-containing protein [Terracidiphilus sp.]